MDTILLHLPTIFSYWSGILLAWSIATVIGIGAVIQQIYKLRNTVRQSDIVALLFVVVGAGVLSCALFLSPQLTATFMDVLLGINIWYMLFLSYVANTNLKILPLVCCRNTKAKSAR